MSPPHDRAPGRGAEGREDQVDAGSSTSLPSAGDIPAEATAAEYSGARTTKRRGAPRGPRKATVALRSAILDLIEMSGPPLTVRQVYYRGVSFHLWDKDADNKRRNYNAVIRHLGDMREDGTMPWSWIADNTRWVREPEMYGSAAAALNRMARLYRANLWDTQPIRVEVWVESDSVASFVDPITEEYGLPLFACRGQASKTYVYHAAREAAVIGKHVVILYLGDWDPTGTAIDLSVAERLERYGDGRVSLEVERVAVTAAQVPGLVTSSHRLNHNDTNTARFLNLCDRHGLPHHAVETEAIEPRELRRLLRNAIEGCILDRDAWQAMLAYEDQERDLLAGLAAGGAR